jgi:hypothetical protein
LICRFGEITQPDQEAIRPKLAAAIITGTMARPQPSEIHCIAGPTITKAPKIMKIAR